MNIFLIIWSNVAQYSSLLHISGIKRDFESLSMHITNKATLDKYEEYCIWTPLL